MLLDILGMTNISVAIVFGTALGSAQKYPCAYARSNMQVQVALLDAACEFALHIYIHS